MKLTLVAPLLAAYACSGREIDRRCMQGDCVVLSIKNGRVVARRTGEFSGERDVGKFTPQGVWFVPRTEAPILYSSTRSGWRAILTAFLPGDFDYDAPELRLRILSPPKGPETVVDDYNVLGSFHIGRIFNTEGEFLQMSTTGAHAYVVRTRVWLLPHRGLPDLLLDVPGSLERIQISSEGQPAGLWIDRETYDGVHAETKGHKREFWIWTASRETFSLAPDR